VGVDDRFRVPRRPRRGEDDGDVARCALGHGDGLAVERVDLIRRRQHEPGLDPGEHGVGFTARDVVVQRHGDGSEPPRSPVQDDGVEAVGELPRHRITTSDAPRAQAPRDRLHLGDELLRTGHTLAGPDRVKPRAVGGLDEDARQRLVAPRASRPRVVHFEGIGERSLDHGAAHPVHGGNAVCW
jgi:hypothetical protein